MQPIIYNVAVSIDGFITDRHFGVEGFANSGRVVDDYLERLKTYSVAVMGRATYEFGYRYRMKPGENPYPYMTTIIVSKTLLLPQPSDALLMPFPDSDYFLQLKSKAVGPIYLAGGGHFAGSLLELGLIDMLRLKRTPIVTGGGIRLLGDTAAPVKFDSVSTTEFADGYVYQELRLCHDIR